MKIPLRSVRSIRSIATVAAPALRLTRAAVSVATAVLIALATLGALLAVAAPAQADTLICEQFGSTTVGGQYVVQNNRWGTSATQCVNATAGGFQVTQADGSVPTNGAPKSYPSIFNGCHYTNCSPGTKLPAQLSGISSAPSSIAFTYVGNAVFDAAYDIWLDPQPKTDGVNRTEIMIWFNHVGAVQPVGAKVGTANVAGRSWDVWTGNNGGNDVISFVAPSPIAGWSFDVKAFTNETVARGMAQNSWYLTSIQAGFEPWQNGAGLAVTSFSSTINLGGGGGGGGGDTPAGCKVTYGTSVWSNGFTANVTVANTGSAAVNGWKVGFTLPSGQAVTSSWNAALSASSGAVVASNLPYNAQIAGNGSQSFGFQGTYSGSFTKPGQFTLNGAACTVA
ncbi:cellulose binding domain-containing protein [Streptomyces sp. NPDC006733]|uniref:GH12 family glycosyl hydrolase domain-containing protein n=1 Tax=Streptomyces sp. NPDC006733 TaxID=3155460 RepID=UPI00340804ED